jgi:hypothetical protein
MPYSAVKLKISIKLENKHSKSFCIGPRKRKKRKILLKKAISPGGMYPMDPFRQDKLVKLSRSAFDLLH